jgi:hypothetical protein
MLQGSEVALCKVRRRIHTLYTTVYCTVHSVLVRRNFRVAAVAPTYSSTIECGTGTACATACT